MKKYNLFVLLPNLDVQGVDNAKTEVEEIIKKIGAQVEKREAMGKRKLSYVIKRIRHGFYLNYVLKLDGEQIKNLEKQLKLSENILRYELSVYKENLVKKNAKIRQEKTDIKYEEELNNKNKSASSQKKVSMKELNEKLDNILKDDIK